MEILNYERNGMRLFQDLKSDFSLPKYKIMERDNNDYFASMPADNISHEQLVSYFTAKNNIDIETFNGLVASNVKNVSEVLSTPDIIRFGNNIRNDNNVGLLGKLKKLFRKNNDKLSKKEKKFDVIKFFADIKVALSQEEATKYADRINDYLNCIGYTEKSGQTAFREKLLTQLVINKYESILYAKGFYKILHERNVVDMAKNSPKGLQIDYICNFIRAIPTDVIDKKIEADKLCIFDNYVVLYYDPENKSSEMTNEEKEKAKDPILFGVISGSNKLYYIADWIDEYCDLTFDKCVELLGKDIVEKNYLSEKTNYVV